MPGPIVSDISDMKARPKISVFIATSIDGYIARENGDVEWLHFTSGEDYGYEKFFASIDVLILGRNTYEKVLSFGKWPYKGKRVIVLSNTLSADSLQHGTELYKGNTISLIEKLSREGIQHIYIDGGFTIRGFLKTGIVDQIILSIIPVILGSGIKLFDQKLPETWYRLVSAKPYPSGLVLLQYALK